MILEMITLINVPDSMEDEGITKIKYESYSEGHLEHRRKYHSLIQIQIQVRLQIQIQTRSFRKETENSLMKPYHVLLIPCVMTNPTLQIRL